MIEKNFWNSRLKAENLQNFLKSQEQFIHAVKGQNNFWYQNVYQLFPEGFSHLIGWNNYNANWKKILGFIDMQEKLENTFLKNTFLKTNSKFVKILHCAPNAKWHSSSCTKCIVEGFKEVFGVRKVLLAIRFKWQIGFLCIRLSHYILVEIRLPESWPGFITANKKILFVWKTIFVSFNLRVSSKCFIIGILLSSSVIFKILFEC